MNDKIKIIHFINTLYAGGMERMVIELCNSLDVEIYDVTLVVLSNNALDLEDMVAPHVHLILLPVKYKSSSILNILLLLLHINKIKRIIKDKKADIVHTHTYQYNVLPVLMAISMIKIKLVHFHTVHTAGIHYTNKTTSQRIKIKVENFWYKKLKTNIICISDVVRQTMEFLFPKRRNSMTTIYNGVDTKKFNPDLYEKPAHKDIKIAYTARLDQGKSHDTLLRALALLLLSHKNIEVVLIGDGMLRNYLESLSRELAVDKNVSFLGTCRNIPKILSTCDIGVFPSEFEGFGLGLLEMMAMELPVVCTDIPVFHSIVGSNSNGLFFPLRDEKQLAKQLELFINNKELREEYGSKALSISKKYSLDNMVKIHEKTYDRFIVKDDNKN